MIHYNNKKFISIQNTANGEVGGETIFHYWQEGQVVWATYRGGAIVLGNLIARADRQGRLDMRYQHVNQDGEIKTGHCISTPQLLEDGRIRLHEKWQWTGADQGEGESVVEEIKPL